MPAHAEQVLISTGRDDWASRIEEDDDAVLVKGVRELMGRGGKFGDPFHNVMLTHSSFTPSTTPGLQSASAYLFPSFRYVSSIPLEPRAIQAFVQGFLLPNHLHSAHELLSDEQKVSLLQKPEMQEQFEKIQDVKEIIVLICGHGGRDERCGTMGPLLCSEFERIFLARGVDILKDPPSVGASEDQSGKVPTARVGLISHIGGHKFAGNVIIYIPPSFRNDLGESSALGGKGIWYGRVEPKHVEGIVHETIFRGSVIQDLFRGGVGQGGEILRI
ncbi:MAG: hypothetical protein M1827_003598 [Pycnora praestabilis]|nr:MAG: hypothetical protein M1827_003598 [Pycnora praestabilis]